jgi:hypothetical protein
VKECTKTERFRSCFEEGNHVKIELKRENTMHQWCITLVRKFEEMHQCR